MNKPIPNHDVPSVSHLLRTTQKLPKNATAEPKLDSPYPEVPDGLMRQVETAIERYHKGRLASALDLGEALAKAFFGDDVTQYQKARRKDHPFNRFVTSEDIFSKALSRKSLENYTRLYFAWGSYPEDIRDKVPLGIHLLALRVADPSDRIRLVSEAACKGMSFREAEAAMQQLRPHKRAAQSTTSKVLCRRLDKIEADLNPLLDVGLSSEALSEIEVKLKAILDLVVTQLGKATGASRQLTPGNTEREKLPRGGAALWTGR